MKISSLSDFKKTKILATIGPASEAEDVLEELVQAGLNAARLNFSHGTHQEHGKKIEIIRALSKKYNKPIAILADLQGPKIRLGNLTSEPKILKKNSHITLFYGSTQEGDRIPVQVNIFPYLKKGDHILINDGLIRVKVESLTKETASGVVLSEGEIRSHKGVNLPDTKIPGIALTPKDLKDLEFALSKKVDYVAMSFVQDEKDIEKLRKIIYKSKHTPQIVAKIETASAVKNLREIIRAVDMVMVARGDLAIEVGQEEVPIIQRSIINETRLQNKPVIVATQMLESMVHNAEPTRAEVNDIATAVLDQVDAVMLSAETAHGDYPIESVKIMDKIIKRVERYYIESHLHYSVPTHDDMSDQISAIASSSTVLAHQLNAKLILTVTRSGKTARRISGFRPKMTVVAVTDDSIVYQQLALVWGVRCLYVEKIVDNEKAFNRAITHMKMRKLLEENEQVVFVAGTHPGVSGHINSIKVGLV